jgi:hypothetical protein
MTTEPFWAQISEPTLRQGDLLPRCLVPVAAADFATENESRDGTAVEYDLIVLTQSCDLERRDEMPYAIRPRRTGPDRGDSRGPK